MIATGNPTPETKTYTEAEYFNFETQSELRHEYRDGEILETTGGTPNHNQIAANLITALTFALRRKPYRAFITDQHLWISDANTHTYPDVMVVPEPLELKPGRRDTVMNPIFVAEVLSKSTRNYDLGEKFQLYQTIPNLMEYVTIDQYLPHIEHHVKTDRGWLLRDIDGLEAKLILESISVEVDFVDLYDKVEF
ncbi:MAG: Uma2 family endonuclease [Cyanobacteriota bacterium]|nr:Uma2 family endonuclease [Cyanobacteriota bacterium]